MRKIIPILLVCFYCFAAKAQDTDIVTLSDTSWRDDPAFSYIPTLDSMLRDVNNRIDSVNRSRRVVVGSNTSSSGGFANFFQSTTVQISFWVLLGFFVIYIVYTIFFRYPAGKSLNNGDAVEIVEEGKLQDISFYRQKILKAESERDYKSAVRYHFACALANLNELEKIHFAPEKTNADYIREMRNDHLLENFVRISNVFTYVWYGDKQIGESDYFDIRELFTNFTNN